MPSIRALLSVRRDTCDNYIKMLIKMAMESGVETPSTEDLIRIDRARKDKKVSNKDCKSPVDADARIVKMKDGTTHLAYKPEHTVDLCSGVIVAAVIHPADFGDTACMPTTLQHAEKNKTIKKQPKWDVPCEVVADKGNFSRTAVKNLHKTRWKSRISESIRQGPNWWHGDTEAPDAVYANRSRLQSNKGKTALRQRAELVERSFQHVLDRGGQRRTWLRGQENVQKSSFLAVSAFNLGILLRTMYGFGTPKGLKSQPFGLLMTFFSTQNRIYISLSFTIFLK